MNQLKMHMKFHFKTNILENKYPNKRSSFIGDNNMESIYIDYSMQYLESLSLEELNAICDVWEKNPNHSFCTSKSIGDI